MKKDIAMKWIKALESGKYKQATGQMRIKEFDGSYSYCCLGVLRHVVLGKKNAALSNGTKCSYLSLKDVNDCGLKTNDPTTKTEYLSSLNDEGKDFKFIAGLIRKNWKDL